MKAGAGEADFRESWPQLFTSGQDKLCGTPGLSEGHWPAKMETKRKKIKRKIQVKPKCQNPEPYPAIHRPLRALKTLYSQSTWLITLAYMFGTSQQASNLPQPRRRRFSEIRDYANTPRMR